jgi:hypothetical protein
MIFGATRTVRGAIRIIYREIARCFFMQSELLLRHFIGKGSANPS